MTTSSQGEYSFVDFDAEHVKKKLRIAADLFRLAYDTNLWRATEPA